MTELPPGWAPSTLGEIGRYINGRGFKKSEWRDAGRPIIRIQNLTGTSEVFNYFDGDADERHVVRRGDLLVSWAATLGVYRWEGDEAVLNQHIFKVRSHIHQPFHRYLLQHVLAELYRQAHGSGMVHITKGKFDATEIPLPPLAEQGRIVAAIEEHVSHLDAAEASLHRAQHNLDRLRLSAVESWMADAQKSLRLDDLAADGGITDGPFGSNLKSSHYTETGPRVVRLENVGRGEFLPGDTHISSDHYKQLTRHGVHAGDLVIASLYSDRLRSCLVPEIGPAIVKADCIRVRLHDEVDRRFVQYALLRPSVDRWCENRVQGVGRQRLGLKNIRELPIPSLPVRDQRMVADRLDELWRRSERQATAISRQERRSQQLRRAVLAAAFAGQLVPQDPADEPTSVLLDRTRAEAPAKMKFTRKNTSA